MGGWHLWSERMVRMGLGGVFIAAGALKLSAPREFARVIEAYGIVPDPLLAFVAIGLPALEVLAGLGLLFGVRGSLGVILGLLVTFVGVLAFAVLMDLEVDCGCFSTEELDKRAGLRWALARDFLMIGAAGFLYWRNRRVALRQPTSTLSHGKD